MSDALLCSQPKHVLSTISKRYFNRFRESTSISDFNVAVVGKIAVTEFLTGQVHNSEEEIETSRLQ